MTFFLNSSNLSNRSFLPTLQANEFDTTYAKKKKSPYLKGTLSYVAFIEALSETFLEKGLESHIEPWADWEALEILYKPTDLPIKPKFPTVDIITHSSNSAKPVIACCVGLQRFILGNRDGSLQVIYAARKP